MAPIKNLKEIKNTLKEIVNFPEITTSAHFKQIALDRLPFNLSDAIKNKLIKKYNPFI